MRILRKTGWRWLLLSAAMGLTWITFISRPHIASSEDQQDAKSLEQIWIRLADKNEARAHTAMWLLINRGEKTVTFLSTRLRPVFLDTSNLASLIKQLDDDSFQVREEASRMLREMGPIAEPLLRKTVKSTTSLEVRARCLRLLEVKLSSASTSPQTKQFIRSVRVLECIGSDKAKALLKKLAVGTPGARETRRVIEALKWIRRRSETGAKRHATVAALDAVSQGRVGRYDWPQWGGWSGRNNTPFGTNIPQNWDVRTGKNIKWSTKLGSQTYGNPSVANGKVFIGTNNGAGYLKRYPSRVDLGVLLCFDEKSGSFLWQYSSPKLASGRVHDWPEQGMPSTPLVDGNRLWAVTNRCEIVCLDTEGFLDGQNDGPYFTEPNGNKNEADVVWKFDMIGKLGVSPHNLSTCSMTSAGDVLFVCTSNGVDASHVNLPAPDAPSFMAMDRTTGIILWKDRSPGLNILHGQWSSPAYGVFAGQPQVLLAGGDGWLYSFDPLGDGKGKSKLLWKFDLNPKHSIWILGGRGTRNSVIGFPCIYNGLIYIVNGQDPEHSTGMGHLWCIDPTKRGDVSSELAFDPNGKPIPHRRLQAADPKRGDRVIDNPNSAAVWHYGQWTLEEYENLDFEKQMHRSIGTPVIKDDILYISDFAGLTTCLDARTGKRYWAYDAFTSSWGSALLVDGKVFVGDEQGDISIFPHTTNPIKAIKSVNGEPRPALGVINMQNAIYSTPIVANNVLYIATKNMLYAIEAIDNAR